MIIISDCNKDIVIPAGLGDNPGVVYETAGVKSLNGETGDLKIKTVNGNDMLGDGNIEIKGGVETLNGETGDVKIKTVNGQSLMGEGDVSVDVGVETLNGQKGNLKIKSVNGAEMLGEGNVAIDTGVESLNGQKGALTLKTVNGNELTGEGNIEIKAGVESVNGETGNVIVKSLKYKQVSNANRKEVYDDVKAHWSDASGYTGDYVYYYQKDKDQIIFDEVKFEENRVWFNSATLYYTSGQVHNPRMRLFCCFFNSGEEIRINENDSVVSDVNGMRYRSGNVINDGGNISFTLKQYGNGFDIYNSTNTGMQDGLFDAQFDSGIYGYKGNTPANIFTDGTDVFMAFDVVDYHYVYKMLTGTSWAFVSKTKIGGVQSSEVSNIKVLTQAEYDALTTKDENVLYCIKG